jgi:stearoyl-CoA desaturase (delta-9 desaturase)
MIKNGAFYHILKNKGSDMHQIVNLYAKDFQNSPLEEFYLKHPYIGKLILLFFIFLVCDVLYGLVIWVLAVIWMHLMEERLHVAISHYWGYRNFETKDNSRNIIPWAFILFGEELHNNHHAKPSNWSFRAKWFEIDPAAIFIQLLIWTKLAYPTSNLKT